MPPASPAKFRSPLTTPYFPIPTASEYSPDHGFESDNLSSKDVAAAPTPAALLDRQAGPQYYITLTVTQADETYVTTILLGDDYPGSYPTNQAQQTGSSPTLTASAAHNSGLSSGSIAGIIIGVLGGLAVLAGIFYVYILRARQYIRNGKGRRRKHRRRKKKKKKKKKRTTWYIFKFRFMKRKNKRSRRSSTSTSGPGPGPAPPPPAGGGPPPPPPPGDAGPPPPPPPPAE